ncbi:Embryonic ectoderm development [Binucleata daphniae]
MCCEFAEENTNGNITNESTSIIATPTESKYLLVAGANGIIKVIDLEKGKIKHFLKGHGNTINTIKTHTQDRSIIFSGSADLSIRMWDIRTGKTVCIFGGIAGHRDQILSLDVSLCGKYLVSGSHDCTVKMWKIPEKCKKCKKYCIKGHSCENKEEISCIYFPIFSSAEIHRSFITCVRFYGNFIMAKGNSNRLVLFEPDCNTKIYDSFDDSECLFIQDWECKSSLSFKINLNTYENRAVISSNTNKGEFYDIDLMVLDDNKSVGICNTKVSEIIRDISIKSHFYYIIYTNSVLHRIKRR